MKRISVTVNVFINLLLCFISSAVYSEKLTIEAPDSGVELGWGYNVMTQKFIPSKCNEFVEVKQLGQYTQLTLSNITSTSDMLKSMDIKVSESGGFGDFSASSSIDYATSSNIKSSNQNILLNLTVNNGSIFAGPIYPQLERIANDSNTSAFKEYVETYLASKDKETTQQENTVGLKPWASALDPKELLETCGTHYVSSISSGLKAYALFSIETKSDEEKQDVTAKLHARYGSASFSSSAAKENDKFLENYNITMTYHQIGGSGGIIPYDALSLDEKIENVTSEAMLAPKYYSVTLSPYSKINVASKITPINRLFEWKLTLSDILNDIEQVKLQPAQYDFSTGVTYFELDYYASRVLELQKDIEYALQYQYNSLKNNTLIETLENINKTKPTPCIGSGKFSSSFLQNDKTEICKDIETSSFSEVLANVLDRGFFYTPELLKIYVPKKYSGSFSTQQNIIDFYVTPAVKKRCEVSANKPGCLTPEQLANLSLLVPTNISSKANSVLGYASVEKLGYLCIFNGSIDNRSRACVNVQDDQKLSVENIKENPRIPFNGKFAYEVLRTYNSEQRKDPCLFENQSCLSELLIRWLDDTSSNSKPKEWYLFVERVTGKGKLNASARFALRDEKRTLSPYLGVLGMGLKAKDVSKTSLLSFQYVHSGIHYCVSSSNATINAGKSNYCQEIPFIESTGWFLTSDFQLPSIVTLNKNLNKLTSVN